MPLSEHEKQIRRRLRDDFPHYAEKALRIRTKSGSIEPLVLNAGQRLIHDRAERQLAETGKVRALVLKARQMGFSTYIEGRLFWKVTHRRGVRAFILTHRDDATKNLFAMAKRYYDACPEPVKPALKASNATELDFGALDSGYRVATAESRGVGRSDTIQYLHGSEVAFWSNAAEHAAGAMQAVPDQPGTEVWLESTANGLGGYFYDMWQAAKRGDNAYDAIFVPWLVHGEYVSPVPDGWRPPGEFVEYAAALSLAPEQVRWAWEKNAELATADGLPTDEICWRFRQEYPSTEEEAFQSSGHDSFVRRDLVLKARKWSSPDQSQAPLVIGVDTARGGADRTRIIDRQGRCAGSRVNETMHTDDEMQIAGRLAQLIDQHDPDAVFIDVTGGGGNGAYSRLKERGYRMVYPVNFGAKALDDGRWPNRRCEMWGRMREWFADEAGADIPDDEMWQSHICAPGKKVDSLGRTVLEPKEDIKKRVGFSPDIGDSLALTFAENIHRLARRKERAGRVGERTMSRHDAHAW